MKRILDDNPILRDIIEDFEKLINELIMKYRPISIIIGGSLAKSKFVRGLSDIDILIVTNYEISKYERFILKAIKDIDIEITVYSIHEIKNCLKDDDPFINDTIRNGIEIYGNLRDYLKY